MSILASSQNKIKVAIENAKLGFKVIRLHGCVNGVCTCGKPQCKSAGKHPNVGKGGVHNATLDENIIRQWYAEQPASNLGLAPSETQIAFDIDPKNDGDQSWAKWEAAHGPFPRTPTQRTGGGGRHYIFSLPKGLKIKPRNNADKIAPGIDIRTHGGLIVVAPSVTDKGDYEWLIPLSEPLAECPQWLLSMLIDDDEVAQQTENENIFGTWASGNDDEFSSHAGSTSGERRHTLWRLIGTHLARGDALESIKRQALEWGEKCDPPLSHNEIMKAVNGIANKDERNRDANATPLPLVLCHENRADAQEQTELPPPCRWGVWGVNARCRRIPEAQC